MHFSPEIALFIYIVLYSMDVVFLLYFESLGEGDPLLFDEGFGSVDAAMVFLSSCRAILFGELVLLLLASGILMYVVGFACPVLC